MFTLKLDESKKWIILEALVMLTSDEGVAILKKKFPAMHDECMAREIEGILEQFGPPPELLKTKTKVKK